MKTPPNSEADSRGGDQVGTENRQRWPGGYVRNRVFVIERKIGGRKFHVSTHATTLRGAMKQLEAFEADPGSYQPAGAAKAPDALVLTEALIDVFHEWHLTRVSRSWALDVKNLLIDWANHFRGADLRELSLVKHIEPHLEGNTQLHHRVSALKAFMKWARKTERIHRAQDVTLDLEVPQVGASEDPKDMDFALVVETFPFLDLYMRDIVLVLSATGWHLAELRRFATAGTIRERNHRDGPEVIGVIGCVHKNALLKKKKEKHFTALVHKEHFEAATRIRELGHLYDRGALLKRMNEAAAAVTAERRKTDPKAPAADVVFLGAFRHSVTTWLSEGGLSDAQVAKYVGHSSEAMARKHYINKAKTALVLPRAMLRVVS